jgi:hypothetical protein
MRALRRLSAFVALLVLITLGATALPHPADAQTTPTTVAANTPGTLPDGDDIPSCSLFPTRLGVGQWQFTNRRDFTITLQIVTTSVGGLTGPVGSQTIVFDSTLAGGESTPVFTLTPDTVIHWAGGTYHVSAYDLVNCLEEEGPLPTTTTEVPVTTPLSVAPPPTTTAAPPTSAPLDVAPTGAAAETLAPTTTAPVAVEAVTVSQGNLPVAAARSTPAAEPLPTTGFPVGLAALAAVTIALIGLALMAISRVHDAERPGEELRR